MRLALTHHPLALLHFIERDIDEADRIWFDACRLDSLGFQQSPVYEAARVALVVIIGGVGGAWFAGLAMLGTALLIVSLATIARARRRGETSSALIARLGRHILLRAMVLALISSGALTFAPPTHVVPLVVLLMNFVGIDLFAQFPLPVESLAANVIGIVFDAVALSLRIDQSAGFIIVLVPSLLFSIHVCTFNLYYMFSTRRLRTRKLKAANETIQLLLNQYDEHGSDCLVETDRGGYILNPSDRLARLSGRAIEELRGQRLLALYEPGPERSALRRASVRHRPFRDMIAPVTTPDGRRWWLLSGCAVFDSAGKHSGYRGFIRDVTDRYLAENRVRYLAQHDALTEVANRTAFHTQLDDALSQLDLAGGKGDCAMAVLFIDLDRFKLVNDSLGHAAGDRALVVAARRLQGEAGVADLVARLGGDEFAVLVGAPTSEAAVNDLAARIVERMAEPIEFEGFPVRIGASIGVAVAPRARQYRGRSAACRGSRAL